MPLYYKLDKYKYMEKNKIENEKDLSFWRKTIIILLDSIIGRDYITHKIFIISK